MKQITLNQLSLLNFKGIQSLTIDFTNETFISGDNATGKTTIFDAFTWLLFGKNSEGKTDFNVKTLDKDNNPIHRLSHEVVGVLTISGDRLVLKKSLAEKWTRRRGSGEEEFSGHETTCYIDDVPVSLSEYAAKVSSICTEAEFKMLTNPFAFPALNWQDQRKVLIAMAGKTDPRVICAGNNEYLDLLDRMKEYQQDAYKKLIAARKAKCKEELVLIPARVDEQKRMLPEKKDWAAIENEIVIQEKELSDLNGQLSSKLKLSEADNAKALATSKLILQLKTNLQEIEQADKNRVMSDYYKKLDEYNKEVSLQKELSYKVTKDAKQQERVLASIDLQETNIGTLKNEWRAINAEALVFPEGQFVCPTCKQQLPTEDIESKQQQMQEDFNKSKSERLAANVEKGKSFTAKVKEMNLELASLQPATFPATEPLIEPISPTYSFIPTPEYRAIEKQIAELQKPTEVAKDTQEEQIKESVSQLELSLSSLRKDLQSKLETEKINIRLEELYKQEKALSQALANEEKEEQLVFDYTKLMIEYVESKVADLFKVVKFKLYNMQINGGTEETCQAMVDGVPFADLNNGCKTQAGLHIINALSQYKQISAPVFIDNRESTNAIPKMECQVINLVVTKENQLTIK